MPSDKTISEVASAILELEGWLVGYEPEDPRKTPIRLAAERAVAHTFDVFTRAYPELESLIDMEGKKNLVLGELLKIFSLEDDPDPKLMAENWAEFLPQNTKELSFEDLEKAATTLVEQLQQQVNAEPDLAPFIAKKI